MFALDPMIISTAPQWGQARSCSITRPAGDVLGAVEPNISAWSALIDVAPFVPLACGWFVGYIVVCETCR
jgi:hypothetical protein